SYPALPTSFRAAGTIQRLSIRAPGTKLGQTSVHFPIMQFAAIQMNSAVDPGANVARAEILLAQAADAGADLAVLPENFALMGAGRKAMLAAAEADGSGTIQDAIAASAQTHGLWVVAGTLPL